MELIQTDYGSYQKYEKDGVDIIIASFMLPENDILGKYVDAKDYDLLIDKDTDFYLPPKCDMSMASSCDKHCIECLTEEDIAFKFRKNVFSKEEQVGAYEGLFDAAVESNNRGLAAGNEAKPEHSGKREWVYKYQDEIMDYFVAGQPRELDGTPVIVAIREKFKDRMKETSTRGGVWIRSQVLMEFEEYDGFFEVAVDQMTNEMSIDEAKAFAKKMKDKMVSKTSYATPLWSGIAGYYGRYPRIPYGRATAYTEHHLDKFEKCYPFARKLDNTMAELLPERYAFQKKCADSIDKRYLIGEDTTFTTITVNTTTHDRNARMACHRDAGSLNEGFSNLTVLGTEGKDWTNGYLVAPEIRAAINVRPGDLLLIDNMRVIHGNTPIEEPASGKEDMMRMSLVFYFREDMLALGEKEYEDLRRQFVDDRRKDETHPEWRKAWNGVSANMWDSQEWYDYLEANGGEEMVKKYHPSAYNKVNTLEGFF